MQGAHTSPCSAWWHPEKEVGEKVGIVCDGWSQVTAVQDCQALPVDTVSDEEEKVLQQKTNIKQRGCTGVFLTCVWFSAFGFFSFLRLEGKGSCSSGPGMPPYCADKEGMVVFSILALDWLLSPRLGSCLQMKER